MLDAARVLGVYAGGTFLPARVHQFLYRAAWSCGLKSLCPAWACLSPASPTLARALYRLVRRGEMGCMNHSSLCRPCYLQLFAFHVGWAAPFIGVMEDVVPSLGRGMDWGGREWWGLWVEVPVRARR